MWMVSLRCGILIVKRYLRIYILEGEQLTKSTV